MRIYGHFNEWLFFLKFGFQQFFRKILFLIFTILFIASLFYTFLFAF